MWELNNGSYYKWEDSGGADRELVASLIHHGPEDGVNPRRWGVQIQPVDGGIVVIGYIHEDVFAPGVARAITDYALLVHKTFDWWIANAAAWFAGNTAEAANG